MPETFKIDWGVGEVIRDFAGLRDTLGSTGGTATSLHALGAGLGISDIRGAAEALHRASLSGLGQVTASRYGLPYRPFEIGEATDRGALLLQALEGLWQTNQQSGFRTALADARNLGMEDMVGFVHLSRNQTERFREIAMLMEDIISPERQAAATMLNAETDLLNKNMNDLGLTIKGIVTPHAAAAVGWLNQFISGMRGDSAPSGSSMNGSMNANTAALEQNTRQMQLMQGFYGAGRRARSSINPGFGLGVGLGQYIADNLKSLKKNMGSAPMGP